MGTTERGPNLNVLDLIEPMRESPLYTSWRLPVPPEWYSSNRRAYTLVDQDALYGSLLYSRNYGRAADDTLSTPVDTAVLVSTGYLRTSGESFFDPAESTVTTRTFVRTSSEALAVPEESTRLLRNSGVLVQPIVHDYP